MHTITTDKEWATRHLYEKSWVEDYWKSRDHPHRAFLVEKICKYAPINSILEVGCASGPNLYNIAKKFPNAEIRGIDINPSAVEKGNEWLKQEGISNVKLEVGRAQELNRFANKSFDIVFTDAVLIYISPNEIKKVVKEMLRISRVVILNEWHAFKKWLAVLLNEYYYFRLIFSRQRLKVLNIPFKPKSASLGFFARHWVRDYRMLFEEFVPKERILITKLPKEVWNDKSWQQWGAIIEVWSK